MKSITIQVPPEGVTLQLRAKPNAVDPQAVLVLPADVDVVLTSKTLPNKAPPSSVPATSHDAAYVVSRLRKLRVKSEAAAINSIKAMFQFQTPISDAEAKNRLNEARRKGLLKIDATGKITFKDA
ncbi:MAG: hypothetical protein WD793_04360 [Steroidobacteraceae bacterium]